MCDPAGGSGKGDWKRLLPGEENEGLEVSTCLGRAGESHLNLNKLVFCVTAKFLY